MRDLWLLGCKYSGSIEEFNKSFSKIPWFTYRTGFPVIPLTEITNDVGWGCMVRSGQMIMCQALCSNALDNSIVEYEWFNDNYDSPFSLQNIVQIGSFLQCFPNHQECIL